MPTMAFRFPGGRYHATPWGRHVNEGAIEWPPSPWRILRALIATGFSKLKWGKCVPSRARDLIERLASVDPLFKLPPTQAGHTRHWMPTNNKITKIFDTFLTIDPEDKILAHYPCNLPQEAEELLDELLTHMSYLGRAESWVDAWLCKVEAQPDSNWCRVSDMPPAGGDQESLLSTLTATDYANWRTASLTHALEEEAKRKGKSLNNSQRAKLEAMFPLDLVACLCTDTAFLQKHGWSQPPGSRRVLYGRPAGTIERHPVIHLGAKPDMQPVTCALLALSGDNISGSMRPLFHRCLPQAEFLHQALLSKCGNNPCPAISGRNPINGKPLTGHQHMRYIPIDRDGDGRIDHYLLYAPMGLDEQSKHAIASLRRTFAKGIPDIIISCCGLGLLADVKRQLQSINGATLPCLDSGTVWKSITPFVAPLHMKKPGRKNDLEDQVRRSLHEYGVPQATEIRVLERPPSFFRFVCSRRKTGKEPPATWPWALQLTFSEPVNGPLTIGYGSHFGLGLFAVDQ